MWNIQFVEDTLNDKLDQLKDKDIFIRDCDFSRDLRQAVLSRQSLVQKINDLEEIRDEIRKCMGIEDMNDYIAQKALVYTLIEKYKGNGSTVPVATTLAS